MNQWKKNNWFALLGVLPLLMLTYFRENFLLSINASLAGVQYNRAYSYWFSNFFQNMNHSNLMFWKWGITIVFSGVMSLITVFLIHLWFLSKKMTLLTLQIYGAIFISLFLLGIGAYVIGYFDTIYFVLRKILGFIQSPLPFFVFFILFFWLKENKLD